MLLAPDAKYDLFTGPGGYSAVAYDMQNPGSYENPPVFRTRGVAATDSYYSILLDTQHLITMDTRCNAPQ